jgi:transcriptional regulator with XRE-family HTH domain
MQLDELVLLAETRAAAVRGDARRIRVAARVSQPELAEVCGIAASAISRWESGLRAPRGSAGLRYAFALLALSAKEGTPLKNDDGSGPTEPLVPASADESREHEAG